MREKILKLLQSDSYHPMVPNQIFQLLNLKDSKEFTQLVKTLNQLEDEGEITHNSRGEYATFEKLNLAKGIIDVKDGGYAFVDTDLGGIFIKSDNINGAITYDEVLVEYYLDNLGRYEGKVVKIIKRNTRVIIGPVSRLRQKAIVRSIDSKIKLLVFIKEKDLKKAKVNDIVKVEITEYFPNMTADGKVVEVYGNKHLPGLDITSMVLSSGVPVEFPEDVRKEIKTIPNKIDSEVILQKNPKIRDLRDKLIITIDGDDAKDLDDAISLEYNDSGNYHLGVYIADVSHYVQEKSPLDTEALNRGTSVYLPDRVIPMLPKELSNGICSLNEKVDRLVMACEMEIDHDGKIINHDIFEAIINNKHRMTYSNVNAMLEDKNQAIRDAYFDIYPMLKQMNELAKTLRNKRIKRGSFEFESLEPRLILDQNGKVVDIVLRKQRSAEKLIEEFMLAANETVAEAMTWLNVPFIYRVHEEPSDEKITKLLETLDLFGYNVKIKNKKAMPKKLQEVLLSLENDEEKDSEELSKDIIINQMMIRSMSKAKYQEYNIGHFGLASECYTHFTSPIRRYPDLLVHRLVKQFMLGEDEVTVTSPFEYFASKVNYASIQSSKTEKRAEVLERDCVDYKKVEYASRFIGTITSGLLTSITNFGVFITLDNSIEGLVKYADMQDDYYDVDDKFGRIVGERNHKVYQIGDRLTVKIVSANLEKSEINFKIIKKED
ncbi:MAG TPA: ribonuclease R [Acholeplasmatales bacterium]|nr:ribonuclease R [Acholeplasmatales bacterium]